MTRGDFVLASGRRSSYYIDARRTTMSGEGQLLIGKLGVAALDEQGWAPRAVGGLTLGADPVAYAIAHAARRAGRSIDAFTVRKEAKGHGLGRRI
ncbi:MAG: orotate phosphoribosyltransferase, partial [Acidobacteriota bacterium]